MTTFLLIRHATCDPVGHSLAGRAPGVPLNAAGAAEASDLARRLQSVTLDAIYSSPIQRAEETARAIAAGRDIPIQRDDALTELDFAQWTGRTFSDLDGDPQWRRFNGLRSMTRASSGELMLEVQSRAIAFVERIRRERPDDRVALVSHGDLIRGLVAHLAGIPLDLFQRIEIDPASVSVVEIGEQHVRVRCVNVTGTLLGTVIT